jgi:hypothetical protein
MIEDKMYKVGVFVHVVNGCLLVRIVIGHIIFIYKIYNIRKTL